MFISRFLLDKITKSIIRLFEIDDTIFSKNNEKKVLNKKVLSNNNVR